MGKIVDTWCIRAVPSIFPSKRKKRKISNTFEETIQPRQGCSMRFPLHSVRLEQRCNEVCVCQSAWIRVAEIPNIGYSSACFPPPTSSFGVFQHTFRHALQISDQLPPNLAECGPVFKISSPASDATSLWTNVKFCNTPERTPLTLYMLYRNFSNHSFCFQH